MKQTITRKGSFDSMHRVMNERMKCFNIHGHTYLYELEFEFSNIEKIGYAIDFKEIKRIACQFIDDVFDHGAILNPVDFEIIKIAKKLNSKVYIMSLNDKEYCNPSVENISKELFLSIQKLMDDENLKINKIILYETPNCYCTTDNGSITEKERKNFLEINSDFISKYKKEKGKIEYDDTK